MTAEGDPFVPELHYLHNQLKGTKEVLAARGEMDVQRADETPKDKAFEKLKKDVRKLEEKLRASEDLLEQKEVEMKKVREEKEDALAAQYAAEATLGRVYADSDQKDDDSIPLESIISPLEAQIKIHKQEILTLQEDNKALERLTKAKEAALVEAERILRSALERALIVEDVQNQNFELRRQIEICQEENKILEKTNRQKVLEIEKLSHTIHSLEQAILAGGSAANAVRDYRRRISELNEEKRTLERELARVKVSANRVALAVANEWKDENDRVMPVKKWLEERRLLHGEMQKLKDKLAISERTAKAEAQLKEKLRLRLKTIEDSLKNPNTFSVSTKIEKTGKVLSFLSRSTSQPRGSMVIRSYALNQLCVSKRSNKVADSDGKENSEIKANGSCVHGEESRKKTDESDENGSGKGEEEASGDMVSGFLYDRLQREVINLRRATEAKDGTIHAKDEEIKILMKRVDSLTKAIEVETKKAKREAAARERENASAASSVQQVHGRKTRDLSLPKSRVQSSR
ncbi:PREDICTED: microtubule-associated protein 70-5 [Tarenaya hassleriana]|uniref:microtubule-associated protein 70-5 n=1 Tax=Tarenaya hassleriana TaxID=28532 RepID=UPI00053C6DF7|nr:PREDICTED: microtubule-associated protein 70-5 [Tarenaya hassleriana]